MSYGAREWAVQVRKKCCALLKFVYNSSGVFSCSLFIPLYLRVSTFFSPPQEEFERVASSNAEDRKARAKQAEADKLKREAEAVQEAEW